MASKVRTGSTGKGRPAWARIALSDTHKVTTPGKLLQGQQCRPVLLNSDPSREARTKNGAGGFGKRESGLSLKHGSNQTA